MEENQSKPERYSLPFIIRSSYKLKMHILLIFVIIMFVGFMFLPIDGLSGIIYKLLCITLVVFLAFTWLYMGVFKKAFIELTEDGISIRTLFNSKKIKWIDIVDVNTYYVKSNLFIGIITKNKLEKRKENFITLLSDLLGGGYTISIPLNSYSTADPEKLYSTMFYTVKEKWQEKGIEEQSTNIKAVKAKEEIQLNGSPLTALFKSLIVSLIIGIIYGLIMYLLKLNLLIIPVLGIMGILYAYLKSYQKKRITIISRFFIGLFCVNQVYIALLVDLLLSNSVYLNKNGIWNTISACTTEIIENPNTYFSYYLFGIGFFSVGAFYGYSSKTTRRIRKIFMHKQNGFYIMRDKRYVTIFMMDYAEYNEKDEKIVVRINPNVCLIEKVKKNILSFYIPEEIMIDLNIATNGFGNSILNNKTYYRLDLGSSGMQQPYGYTCTLILNRNQQVELVQLELD